MKLHNLKPNLLISQMHLKTPTLGAVENETLDLSSRCARITAMVIHTWGVQVLLSVGLHKPWSLLSGAWRRGWQGQQGPGRTGAERGAEETVGCTMAAWGRRRCHLWRICSPARGLTTGSTARDTRAQPPALPARTARSVPCAGRGRPPRADTPRHLLKKQKREKQSQLGPRAESRPDGWKKKQTGQMYWNVAPEGHQSSAQNTGATFSSRRAQENKQATCGGLQVWSSSTRLVHHQETKLLYLADEIF